MLLKVDVADLRNELNPIKYAMERLGLSGIYITTGDISAWDSYLGRRRFWKTSRSAQKFIKTWNEKKVATVPAYLPLIECSSPNREELSYGRKGDAGSPYGGTRQSR